MKFCKKSISLILLSFFILALFMPTFVYAEEERSSNLLILCKNESEYLTLTEYDEIKVVLKNLKTNKTYSNTLYGYNNFSGKVNIPEGDYVVSDIYINGRYDAIILNEGITVTSKYDYVESLIIPLKTIAEIQPGFFETTTSAPTTQPPTVTNPFEIPTLSTSHSESQSQSQIPNTENSTEYTTNMAGVSDPFSNTEEFTTNLSAVDDDSSDTSDKTYIFVIIAIVLFVLVIAVCIAIKKRNNDE